MYHRVLYHLSPWNPENWIFEPGRRVLVWTDMCCLLWARLSFKTAKSYRSLPTFEDDAFFHSFGMYRFCTRIQWNLPDRWSKPIGKNSLLSEKGGRNVKLLNSKLMLVFNQLGDFWCIACFFLFFRANCVSHLYYKDKVVRSKFVLPPLLLKRLR